MGDPAYTAKSPLDIRHAPCRPLSCQGNVAMGEPSSPAKSALTGETASHPHAVDRTGASELALTN